MRTILASTYRTELYELVEQVESAKRFVLRRLMPSKATSRNSSASTMAEESSLQREDVSLGGSLLYAGKESISMNRDDAQKRWQHAQLEYTRSHIS